jgi:hypothetical protein
MLSLVVVRVVLLWAMDHHGWIFFLFLFSLLVVGIPNVFRHLVGV